MGRSSKEISHRETQKPIQEANFDAGSGTLPTAPGSAWMMLGKRGARPSFACMQMRPSTAVQKPPLLGALRSTVGACFQLSTQPWKKERDGLARVACPADTESSQHPCAGGAKSLSPQSVKLGSPSPGPPLTPPGSCFPAGQEQKARPKIQDSSRRAVGRTSPCFEELHLSGAPTSPFPWPRHRPSLSARPSLPSLSPGRKKRLGNWPGGWEA